MLHFTTDKFHMGDLVLAKYHGLKGPIIGIELKIPYVTDPNDFDLVLGIPKSKRAMEYEGQLANIVTDSNTAHVLEVDNARTPIDFTCEFHLGDYLYNKWNPQHKGYCYEIQWNVSGRIAYVVMNDSSNHSHRIPAYMTGIRKDTTNFFEKEHPFKGMGFSSTK